MNKLVVIVGPTSSGKSELAVLLAKKYNGEIISADSRQVYKKMDLGTGKVTGKWKILKATENLGREKVSPIFIYKNIAHHLIDFANPKKQYSAAQFQEQAKKIIADILKRGKLPIICGGTGHWIDAVVYDQKLPDVKPNLKLRMKLDKKSAGELYRQLQKLDPYRAANIDKFNKRRLIRALEIITETGKPVPRLKTKNYKLQTYAPLWLGINPAPSILSAKIKTRLNQRLKAGMVNEVRRLHRQGLPWKKLEAFGLEYKFVSLYLQKKISYDEMFNLLFTAIKQYTKRQMTWWKRNKNIRWIKTPAPAAKLTKTFLA